MSQIHCILCMRMKKKKKRKKEMPCDAHMLIGMGMIELKMHIYSGNVFDNLFD